MLAAVVHLAVTPVVTVAHPVLPIPATRSQVRPQSSLGCSLVVGIDLVMFNCKAGEVGLGTVSGPCVTLVMLRGACFVIDRYWWDIIYSMIPDL